MTRRIVLSAVAVIAVSVLSVQATSAEPIQITSGALNMGQLAGTMNLAGDRGFTLTAGVDVIESNFQPWVKCTGSPCGPGTVIPLTAVFVGGGFFGGTVTLDGETFSNIGSASSLSSASLQFSGSVVAPELSGSLATVSAPFLMQGTFSHPAGVGLPSIVEMLFGQGTASVTLGRVGGGSTGFPDTWAYRAAVYEFQSGAPVPEPATLLLTGGGLIGLVLRKRRQARGTSPREQPLA
jgi:PEP-CTERM motif-containing protein